MNYELAIQDDCGGEPFSMLTFGSQFWTLIRKSVLATGMGRGEGEEAG
jgi:hypothetical protein